MSHIPQSQFSKWIQKYKYLNIAFIYLGTALVVIHFTEAIVHGLHMPSITFSLVVVLVLAGLPIVLLIAWAIGHKKPDIDNAHVIKPVKRNWLKIGFASVLSIVMFVAAIFIYNKFFYSAKFTGKEKSIAVLPFVINENNKNDEYLSDGIVMEIINRLSKTDALKVKGWASSSKFRGDKINFKEVAKELNAAAILSGTFQKSGNTIRIYVELLDAGTGTLIWSEKYDSDFSDIFSVQSDVAQQIVSGLNATISSDEKKKIEKTSTENPDAFKYYLLGVKENNKFWQTHDLEHFRNGKIFFEKALSLDSNYALPHAGLADLYNTFTNFIEKDSTKIKLQLEEIKKAWIIDPANDYVNLARGYVQAAFGNFNEAIASYKRAINIAPGNADNWYGLATGFAEIGLFEEAIKFMDKAIILDPYNASNFILRAGLKVSINDTNGAVKDFQTSITLEPQLLNAINGLAYTYAISDKPEKARIELLKADEINKKGKKSNWASYSYAKTGNIEKAKKMLLPVRERILDTSPDRVYLILNMKEEALRKIILQDSLNKNIKNDYLIYKNHLLHEDFDGLRNNPRFIEILETKKRQYEVNKKKYNIESLIK
jgi:TolB-like protein/Flp pilus assembly protein TadD